MKWFKIIHGFQVDICHLCLQKVMVVGQYNSVRKMSWPFTQINIRADEMGTWTWGTH